ncbi:MAG TPA: DUF748 domain-containing protein [Albitalea sp.]|nr:DUF748 domain-containing protein [Albitalea sp.]
MKWLKRTGTALGILVLSWALAWLAVPALLKWQAEIRGSQLLGRKVSLGDVSFRPWSMELTLGNLTVGRAAAPSSPASSAQAGEPLLHVARVRANLAFWPLLRGVPVVEALDVESPRLSVARVAPGRYDVDDVIDKLTMHGARDERTAETPRFALYNVRLIDGRIHFDDRPAGRVHQLDALQLALPFLSTRPDQVEITVQPHLAFTLNGARFDSGAQATPFAQTRHGLLKATMSQIDVRPYLGYLPLDLPVRVTAGILSGDVAVEFSYPAGGTPSVSLRGWVGASDAVLRDAAGAPLLTWRQLRLGLHDVQPLARSLAFDTLRIEGAELHLVRDASGRLILPGVTDTSSRAAEGHAVSAAAPVGVASRARPHEIDSTASAVKASASEAAREAGPAKVAAPWQIALASIEFAGARVLWTDASVRPAAQAALDDVSVAVKHVRWPTQEPMPVSLSATVRGPGDTSGEAGRLLAEGTANDREAALKLSVSALSLQSLEPYLAQYIVPRVDARVSAQGTLDWAADRGAAAAPRLRVAIERASLDALSVQPASARAAAPAASFEQLAVADVQFDMQARTATLGSVTLRRPSLSLVRDRQGRFDALQWWRGAATTHAAASDAETPWHVQLGRLALQGGRVQLTDAFVRRGPKERALKAELRQIELAVQGFSWFGSHATPAAKLRLAAKVASGGAARVGRIDWNGDVGLRPVQASGTARIVQFPAHMVAAYFAESMPLSLLHAEVNYSGRVALREQAQGWMASAAGDVLLGDVHVTTLPDPSVAALASGGDELLNWQALALKRVKFSMKPGARARLEVGEAALTDFYSRLVVTEDGRFNLRELRAPAAAASAPQSGDNAEGEAAPPAAPVSTVQATAPAALASAPSGVPQPRLPLDLFVGTTTLTNGRIDFSDHFVQPNYSAALTELNGELGAFSSTAPEMATLRLRGRAAGTALLDIAGKINPSVTPIALDIKARATDLELAPLSPYAGKYAGYAIERGKLSLDVAYKIDADGRLEASNQLVLNQLTFGERIDSPSATKLPVLLAVALLKDRHGVIDINLPIRGSINDPKFSVGGIVVKLVFNLLAKALTAPFALLAGGGTQDLSVVAFDAGTTVIAAEGTGAVDKVAKALADRPALRMTVTGIADPALERDAYRHAVIESRLLAERRREGLRAGAAASAPVTLAADDRARLVKQLYRQTDLPGKPRNVLGFAKDVPMAEMEALLRQHVPVTEDAMREIALQRGLAVRDALIAKGLPSERLFVAAPKVRAAADADSGWTPRAQLSLSTR